MAEWFAEEALRVDSIFTESPEQAVQRELVEWVEKQGGSTTAAHLARQGLRRFRGRREEAHTALDALVEAGIGRWEEVRPGSAGGRPTTKFALLTPTADETAPACVDMEPKPPQASLEDEVSYPPGSPQDEGRADSPTSATDDDPPPEEDREVLVL